MLSWLYDLPNIAIASLFGVTGAVLLAAAPFVRAKLLRVKVAPDHSAAARTTLSVIIGFTGVLLSFSLVQAQGNLRNIQKTVGDEAHELAQMDRLLIRMGDPAADAIRPKLRDYANSIVVDEWPQLGDGKPSERTGELFPPVSRGIMTLQPEAGRESLIYTELLKEADEVAGYREARLVAAGELALPLIFWETIFALFAILLLVAMFVEIAFPHVVALGVEGFGVSLLVALVFILDQPFKGHLAVSPNPIARVVAEMQGRTN